MWTHVQFTWWWYLELRRDRDVICIMRYEPNLVLGWIVVELTSIQLSPLKKTFESPWVLVPLRKENDSLLSLVSRKQLMSMSTLLLVELSLLSCISSSPWKNCALIVDCRRMKQITMGSIGEWSIGQTQNGAAKSMRNFVHSGTVMTVGIHFEYSIWASIIVPIALIHSEYVFAYITEVLRAAIGWP